MIIGGSSSQRDTEAPLPCGPLHGGFGKNTLEWDSVPRRSYPRVPETRRTGEPWSSTRGCSSETQLQDTLWDNERGFFRVGQGHRHRIGGDLQTQRKDGSEGPGLQPGRRQLVSDLSLPT